MAFEEGAKVWFRYKKALLGKAFLFVVMLLVIVSGLAGSGCISGLQPVGWAGGVVDDGTLFVSSEEGRLVAIDIASGARRWSEPMPKRPGGGAFGCADSTAGVGCAGAPAGVAIYGTPVVTGDLVYIGGYNGKIYAYDASSLEVRWVYPREDNLEPIVSGAVVAQGKVYVGGSDGKIYALDSETGNREWEPFETGDKIWATPAIDGDTLYVGSFDSKLYALNAADGSQKWSPFETGGAIASAPLVYNGKVYIGSFDRYLYALDATNGSLEWKFMGGNWFWAQPVAYNGVIYAGNLDGKIYILSAETGSEVVGSIDLGSPLSASPVIVNDTVIFASQEGIIFALDADSKELRQLVDIEESVYGPLCASEGIVYVHTQDMTLHPVDAGTGAKLAVISLKSSE